MPSLRVNDEEIDEAEIGRETAAMLALMTEQMPGEDPLALRSRAREWAEDNLIEAALLRQAALADPGTRIAETAALSETTIQRRVQRLVEKITARAPAPQAREIADFYASHRDSFQSPEQLRVAHIVCNIDERHSAEAAHLAIEKARAALNAGQSFAAVADALSDCPGRGGELDLFSRGEMVPAFEEVVFQLRVDEVSSIFRTEFGFHIAKLLERRPARVLALGEVQERIAAQLLESSRQQVLYQYLDEQRARARIVRDPAPQP
jgi:parvulin-like peptidyl-prolyl isomerase